MATKGCSFQYDEKTIIYIDIGMGIVIEKEKLMNDRNVPVYIFLKLNFKIG